MPFHERALVELVNESNETHNQYFYIDYETMPDMPADTGLLHAEFRRTNPFGGWGHEIASNRAGSHLANIANKERLAWDNFGRWLYDEKNQCPGKTVELNDEMKQMKAEWAEKYVKK